MLIKRAALIQRKHDVAPGITTGIDNGINAAKKSTFPDYTVSFLTSPGI